MFAAVRCALGSRAGVRSQLHASSPLSIEIPCSFACRAVESSIESSQSSRRVGLQKFFNRLMSPAISVLKFRVVLHAAQSSRQSSRLNRVVESVSSNFFNRLMSPVISVLKFRVVLHAAQSGRQSSRLNRVVESVARNFSID